MKQAEVLQIINENQSWTSRNGGTFHDYCVRLKTAEGETVEGTASSTSPENPPYAVGDQVFFEAMPGNFGTKLRIKKELTQDAVPRGTNDNRQKEIAVQWALGRATDALPYETGHGYFIAVEEFARELLRRKDEILKG
jgi:hypothetical protein